MHVLRNPYNFAGIIGGAALGMFIIYTPPLHVVFGGTDKLSPLYWLIPVGFGCLLLAWASIRVILMRKSIEQARVKDIKGLMMCECFASIFDTYILGGEWADAMAVYSPDDEDDEYALEALTTALGTSCFLNYTHIEFMDSK